MHALCPLFSVRISFANTHICCQQPYHTPKLIGTGADKKRFGFWLRPVKAKRGNASSVSCPNTACVIPLPYCPRDPAACPAHRYKFPEQYPASCIAMKCDELVTHTHTPRLKSDKCKLCKLHHMQKRTTSKPSNWGSQLILPLITCWRLVKESREENSMATPLGNSMARSSFAYLRAQIQLLVRIALP